MSGYATPLPVVRKVKLQEDGKLKVRVVVPSTIADHEDHELTVYVPLSGTGIAEPSKMALSNALERLSADLSQAVMRLRGLR